MNPRPSRVALVLFALSLAACGQKGPLYLPDTTQGEVVTRPTQTPTGDGAASSPANSPSTPDSPGRAASPAPEVTAPVGAPAEAPPDPQSKDPSSKDPASKDKGKKQSPK